MKNYPSSSLGLNLVKTILDTKTAPIMITSTINSNVAALVKRSYIP